MSESSGGGAGESLWQCRHCRMKFRVPPGAVFKVCPECRAPEQEFDFDTAVYCVNPDCKEKLFTPTQKRCHECTALQPKRQAQRQPKPPRGHVGQATSTPTVPVAGVPSTSPDLNGAQAKHLEAIEKAVEAQRSQTANTQCKDSQSEDNKRTTSPQHMPPTHVVQGAAGSQTPPGFQATMGAPSYLVHHVPAVRPPVPLHSQMVYQLHQGMQTQLPQTGGHTPYPRAIGPAQTFQTEAIAAPGGQNYIPTSQPHTGSPQFSGSQSHDQIPTGVRLPAPVHSQAVHQLPQGTPTQQPQAGGHTSYPREFGPPEAMPTLSGSQSHDQIPTGVRLPAPLHSQAVHQLQQGTPTQQPQAGGHTGPPEAMPTLSGSQSCSQVPPNKHSTPSSLRASIPIKRSAQTSLSTLGCGNYHGGDEERRTIQLQQNSCVYVELTSEPDVLLVGYGVVWHFRSLVQAEARMELTSPQY